MNMRLRFLGSGTSQGVPMIGCDCAVCTSPDPRNKRMRPSLMVETATMRVIVDTPPDFRMQCLTYNLRHADAILITHTHADHILGLDDIRRFCDRRGGCMPLYAAPDHLETLTGIFPHAFVREQQKPGWPRVDTCAIEYGKTFQVGDLTVTPYALPHGPETTVSGFVFEHGGKRFAYFTDCKTVPAPVVKRLKGLDVLILDALRHRDHFSHLTVAQALDVVKAMQPKRTLFTHICHELDHAETEKTLPASVRMAYDGMAVEV